MPWKLSPGAIWDSNQLLQSNALIRVYTARIYNVIYKREVQIDALGRLYDACPEDVGRDGSTRQMKDDPETRRVPT
jgi:hypothetical protein